MSISVLVQNHGNDQEDAYFLAQAYHSSRWLAFLERNCFSTPYDHATIQVEIGPPTAIQVRAAGGLLWAEMSAGTDLARESSAVRRHESWEITIHLPDHFVGRAKSKHFFARLAGDTIRLPFVPSRDVLTLQPSNRSPILGWLIESGFAASQWIIRANATHARSKTLSFEAST